MTTVTPAEAHSTRTPPFEHGRLVECLRSSISSGALMWFLVNPQATPESLEVANSVVGFTTGNQFGVA
jgi:hypothetical protein